MRSSLACLSLSFILSESRSRYTCVCVCVVSVYLRAGVYVRKMRKIFGVVVLAFALRQAGFR